MEIFAVTYYALVSFSDGAMGDSYTSGLSLATDEAYAYKGAMDACKKIFPQDGNKRFARCWSHQVSLLKVDQHEPIYVNGVPYYVQVHQAEEKGK